MNKTETSAAVVKPAYVRPRIVCYAAASESSLCTDSPHPGPGGGHDPAHPYPNPLEPDEGE